MDVWLRSKLFRVSGLDPSHITARIVAECHGGGDFLRMLMEEIAGKQGMRRWADCTPEHLLSMAEIKRQIPEALFIHIIRDGRDVALSYAKQGWSYPLPWDGEDRLGVSGLYWEWIVRKGREQGTHLGPDYQEVRFEELISNPQATLSRLGTFIDHDLDYDRIQQVALGSVHNPNSSFRGDGKETEAGTIGRWKLMFNAGEVRDIESSMGKLLVDTGYILETPPADRHSSLAVRLMNFLYPLYFDFKLWLKSDTPLARIADKGRMGVAESDASTDAEPEVGPKAR